MTYTIKKKKNAFLILTLPILSLLMRMIWITRPKRKPLSTAIESRMCCIPFHKLLLLLQVLSIKAIWTMLPLPVVALAVLLDWNKPLKTLRSISKKSSLTPSPSFHCLTRRMKRQLEWKQPPRMSRSIWNKSFTMPKTVSFYWNPLPTMIRRMLLLFLLLLPNKNNFKIVKTMTRLIMTPSHQALLLLLKTPLPVLLKLLRRTFPSTSN
mmetsp:Transcript_30942/g.74382  ORF Transcript_30942/g.74382 Transcript_30942/m.74382 type:complete len:209 (+) Transcript_30942:662-1288(+)